MFRLARSPASVGSAWLPDPVTAPYPGKGRGANLAHPQTVPSFHVNAAKEVYQPGLAIHGRTASRSQGVFLLASRREAGVSIPRREYLQGVGRSLLRYVLLFTDRP